MIRDEPGNQEDIDIIPFKPQFQEEVVHLFKDGLSPKTYDFGPTVAIQQRLFVESKLSQEDDGDMFNIWESFMGARDHSDESSPSNF